MKRIRLSPFRASVLVLAFAAVAGCDARKSTTTSADKSAPGPVRDAEATALAGLEAQPDAQQCRTVLQQLDNLTVASTRPALTAEEKAELGTFLRLTPAELTEIGQATFSQTDASYLEECLLVRTGVRSLKIDDRPPADRARLGFDWACRMVYVDDRVPWPANPWTTLEAGSGISLSRAYVILAAWQQLGLDGCLVGPPALKSAPSVRSPNPADPDSEPAYAPVRACGVKIDGNILLFDPSSGQPMLTADGKGVLTLADSRKQPEILKAVASADEVKSWQVFLAPPISGLGKRMEWLEQLNPGRVGPKLFVNVAAQRARFAKEIPGVTVDSWSPDGDPHAPGRVLHRYAGEDATTRTTVALRDTHRVRMIPLDRLPKSNLAGNALAHVNMSYGRPFEMLRYTPNSARDLILRGQFSEATSSLEDVKKMIDNARVRFDQDKNLQKEFETWADEFQSMSARLIRAERDNPGGVPAAIKAIDDFRNNPRNRDIERAFVLGNAARPLAAEVAFLMATAVHERAERAHLEGSSQASGHWRNARDWWERFLDASAQARSPFPARDPHARTLLARCQQFISK